MQNHFLDKTGDEAAGEEKQDDEVVNKSETEEAPTAVDGMIHALRATSTALDQAQKSVKTLNSLPINVYFGLRKMQITTLESLNFFWNNVPDTLCLVCGQNFGANEWPPVRTLSFATGDPECWTCWGYWDISVMPSIESYLTLLMTLFMTQLHES